MTKAVPDKAVQLRSLVTTDQTLELSLEDVDVPEPGPDEVLVRVEAAPINPSDLGLLFAGADIAAAVPGGSDDRPVVVAPLSDVAMQAVAGRIGNSMPVGNEGAGTVVKSGASQGAQALLGKTVAVAAGAMYAQYRCVDASLCLALPEGVKAREGASAFVNPMTVLGMVETMRREHHTALVHTAAASNLGQMLNRLCIEEHVPLVNIVRKPEQEALLRSAGAVHVCVSTSERFLQDLTEAVQATSATLAFDAVGGGKLASQILGCMEAAINASTGTYSRYGSTTLKQVYVYGGLDRAPTELERTFGMAWSVGGWLVGPLLSALGADGVAAMRSRVAAGIQTTFASNYTDEVTLAGALSIAAIADFSRQATGAKYLIVPHG